ncbi:Uncharacterised protein [Yersinia pseudotuberculosis]|nr:Uncharacterised protein [Yersinia pseudotuberculosis]
MKKENQTQKHLRQLQQDDISRQVHSRFRGWVEQHNFLDKKHQK